jgi:DNA-binding MarR family transcriptional regulator
VSDGPPLPARLPAGDEPPRPIPDHANSLVWPGHDAGDGAGEVLQGTEPVQDTELFQAGELAQANDLASAGADAARAARVWRTIRSLVLDSHDRRKEVCATLGLSFIRIKALVRLAGGPLTLRHLADNLMTDAPYTTVVVADLERRGLVERVAHPGDRRAKLVRLTPAGAWTAKQAERMLNEPPASLLALGPADLAALDRIVTTLRQSADKP